MDFLTWGVTSKLLIFKMPYDQILVLQNWKCTSYCSFDTLCNFSDFANGRSTGDSLSTHWMQGFPWGERRGLDQSVLGLKNRKHMDPTVTVHVSPVLASQSFSKAGPGIVLFWSMSLMRCNRNLIPFYQSVYNSVVLLHIVSLKIKEPMDEVKWGLTLTVVTLLHLGG